MGKRRQINGAHSRLDLEAESATECLHVHRVIIVFRLRWSFEVSSSWVGSTIQPIGRLLKKLNTISISLSRRRFSCLICWHVVCSDLQWPFQFSILVTDLSDSRRSVRIHRPVPHYPVLLWFLANLGYFYNSSTITRLAYLFFSMNLGMKQRAIMFALCLSRRSAMGAAACQDPMERASRIARVRGAFWIRPVCFWWPLVMVQAGVANGLIHVLSIHYIYVRLPVTADAKQEHGSICFSDPHVR